MKKFFIALLILILMFAVFACEKKTEQDIPNEEEPMDTNPKVRITLNDGRTINLELYPDIAPVSVENFLRLVDEGFYSNTFFHRVIEGFMIQTGWMEYSDQTIKYKPTQPTIKGEFSENGVKNDLKHTAGVISMARSVANDTASAQFFICSDDSPHLDGKYAAFGKVTDEQSLRVVKNINEAYTASVPIIMDGMPLRLDDMPVSLDENGNISLQLIMIVKIERINN